MTGDEEVTPDPYSYTPRCQLWLVSSAERRKRAGGSKVDSSVGYWPHSFPPVTGLCGPQISVSGGPRTKHFSEIKLDSDFVGTAHIHVLYKCTGLFQNEK